MSRRCPSSSATRMAGWPAIVCWVMRGNARNVPRFAVSCITVPTPAIAAHALTHADRDQNTSQSEHLGLNAMKE